MRKERHLDDAVYYFCFRMNRIRVTKYQALYDITEVCIIVVTLAMFSLIERKSTVIASENNLCHSSHIFNQPKNRSMPRYGELISQTNGEVKADVIRALETMC